MIVDEKTFIDMCLLEGMSADDAQKALEEKRAAQSTDADFFAALEAVSMGTATKTFKCDICGHAWTGNGGCEHTWYREKFDGPNHTSFMYDRVLPYKERDMKALESIVVTIAIACHEANRRYCEDIGDDSQVLWDDAPDWQRESAIAGVRGHLSGEITSPKQSHESWVKQKEADGWVYGKVKDEEKKTHHCIMPYGDLPKEQRMKDAIFGDKVREVVAALDLDYEDIKVNFDA